MKCCVLRRIIVPSLFSILLGGGYSTLVTAESNIQSLIPNAPIINEGSYLLTDQQSGMMLTANPTSLLHSPRFELNSLVGQLCVEMVSQQLLSISDDDKALFSSFTFPRLRFDKNTICNGDYFSLPWLALFQQVDSQQLAIKKVSQRNIEENNVLSSTRQQSSPNPDYIITKHSQHSLSWSAKPQIAQIMAYSTQQGAYYSMISASDSKLKLLLTIFAGKYSRQQAWETTQLLTWGLEYFETVSPLKAGERFASEPVWYGRTDKALLGSEHDIFLTIPRGRAGELKASFIIDNIELHAPLAKGEKVGTISFQLDGKTIAQQPLVLLSPVPLGDCSTQIFDKLKLLFHRWFG